MKKVLFIGNGNLGWKTMGQALEQSSASSKLFIPVHRKLSDSFLGKVPRNYRFSKLFRRFDIKFRLQKFVSRTTLLTEDYDHVHCFGHLVANSEFFEKNSISYSVTCDGTWFQNEVELHKPEKKFEIARCERRKQAELAILHNAEFVICTSNWARDSVIDDIGVDPEKVFVNPVPIISDPIVQQKDSASWITFIGNNFYRKGGDILIDAFESKDFGAAELHLVSSDNKPKYIDRVDGAFWHGQVSNEHLRSEILPNTRVLVLPSRLDQSPLVISEAAAAGVPSIVSDIAGLPELVIDGWNGFVIPIGDHLLLADKISQLLQDLDLAETMGENALKHYRENLCSEKSIESLFEKINNVLEQKGQIDIDLTSMASLENKVDV